MQASHSAVKCDGPKTPEGKARALANLRKPHDAPDATPKD